MKKDGFTLIEMIVSIFILLIVFGITTSLSKLNFNIQRNIKYDEYVYEIQNVLSYGKAVCCDKNKYGKITTVAKKNQIRFVEGIDNIEKVIILPKEIKIINDDVSIFIKPNGKIEQGATIKLKDDYGEKRYITIGVGIDRIDIKDRSYI